MTATNGSPAGDSSSLATRPLEGLQVVELSTYVAGPSGAMTLAQLGADVIRVDPVGGATDTRRLPLDQKGNSLYWAGLNKGKRSVELNTSSDEGRRLVIDLLSATGPGGRHPAHQRGRASAGSTTRRCGPHRPDLIEVHITGRSDGKPAVDYTINSEVGLPLITGPVDLDRPVNHVLPAWDLLTGLHAALGDPGRRAGPGPHRQGPAGDGVAGQRGRGHHGPPRLRGRRGHQRPGPAAGGQLPLRQLRLRLLHRRRPSGDGRGPDQPSLAQPGRAVRRGRGHHRPRALARRRPHRRGGPLPLPGGAGRPHPPLVREPALRGRRRRARRTQVLWGPYRSMSGVRHRSGLAAATPAG